jgi:sialic acid synthase SpsE
MGIKNVLNKLVMALNLKNVVVGEQAKQIQQEQQEQQQETPRSSIPPPSKGLILNKDEVETLLIMVKEAHFKGEHVQKVYELVLKLQNYYSTL